MPFVRLRPPERKIPCVTVLLPYCDRLGRAVVTQCMGKLDLSVPGATMERYQRTGYYLLHRALQRIEAQRTGLALLIDFGGFSMTQMARSVKMADIRRGIAMMQDSSPADLSVLYIAHPPRWLNRLLVMVRPLLSKDSTKTSLFLLSSASDFEAHFELEHLPRLWGGGLDFSWEEQLERWAVDEETRPPDFDVSSLVGEGQSVGVQEPSMQGAEIEVSPRWL